MTVTIDLAPCETITLTESHDMGGDGNRGTNVKVTYQNSSGQPIHDETIFGFLTGTNNFPAAVPWPYPWRGARSANVLPYSIKVESVSVYGQGNPPSPPSYSFNYTKTPRPGYNVGGDSFGNAPLAPEQPTAYPGSVYQNWSSSSNPQADPGQYFKVHLKCNQAIDVYGSATGSTQYGASFRIHLYDAAQNLVQQNWIALAAYGTVTYNSSAFTNPNNVESDFYILVTSDSWPVYDFTLNIEYVPLNSSPSPRSVAPDATGGSTQNSEEYHLPASIDTDVLTGRATELWAKVYWPADFSGGPYPLVVFLHGNHGTCGTGTNPHVDDNSDYTYSGTCPPGYSYVNNHLGYEYLAKQLASDGYIVASINANRGITDAIDNERQSYPDGPLLYPDDPNYMFARGRLVLKHLQTLKTWNSGPTGLIAVGTLGTSRKNATGWFGMQITLGPQPITVYSLGRMFLTGNNQTHTVEIVRSSDSVVVGSVSVLMTGGTNGQFKYVNLATPLRLAANTSYYIASQETKNKDSWYDSNTTVTSTSLASVNGRVTSSNGTTWDTSGAVPGNVYVPLDLKYQVLSVNLTGKIDFTNVGLMGHSRGGQGVRAAYNLYRNSSIDPRGIPSPPNTPNINWASKIPGMNIKGIFEIGPTDAFLRTASDGTGSQYLNADGTAWNVLLPICDGDVSNLQGVRAFDRVMAYTGTNLGIPSESPATQKSTYSVWGANHNFYNSEWQLSDSAGC